MERTACPDDHADDVSVVVVLPAAEFREGDAVAGAIPAPCTREGRAGKPGFPGSRGWVDAVAGAVWIGVFWIGAF